ncbi:hypothetical protein [Microcoleus sp. M2_C6]|uniref:hypothetical protein n=1 Tax=Microcoleus sp. M2_C6 TaxID=3055372 RepID=UPI002FD3CEF1
MNLPLQAPGALHRKMYVMIYGSVRAGFRDCLLQAIIVCEPAPTSTRYIASANVRDDLWLGSGGFSRLFVAGNYCL